MKRSKISEVDIFGGSNEKPESKKQAKSNEPFMIKSFRLPVDMATRLKEYSKNIAPKHLKVTESDVIRYMIENFDLAEAKENFFRV